MMVTTGTVRREIMAKTPSLLRRQTKDRSEFSGLRYVDCLKIRRVLGPMHVHCFVAGSTCGSATKIY